MMASLETQGNFRVVVRRSVRILLSGERQDQSSIIAAQGRELVRLLAAGDFDARPLPPQIYAGGNLDHLADVSATHPGRTFQKIEVSVAASANKFRVRYAAHQSQRLDQFAVEFAQRRSLFGLGWQQIGGKNAALLRHRHGWLSVAADTRENHVLL